VSGERAKRRKTDHVCVGRWPKAAGCRAERQSNHTMLPRASNDRSMLGGQRWVVIVVGIVAIRRVGESSLLWVVMVDGDGNVLRPCTWSCADFSNTMRLDWFGVRSIV